MGNTDWGAVASGGLGLAGSIIGSNAAKDASAAASKQYTQDSLGLAQLENEWNRSNMEWTMDANRDLTNENFVRSLAGLKYNRPGLESDFGSTKWESDGNGNFTQKNEISSDLQPALDTLRSNYNTGVGNLDMGDFGVNNDVMNSIRGLQEPGLQRAEDAQRARYAAMGIPIQSTAMDRGEQTLSDNRSRADLQAIGAGNEAWQQGQGSLRSNLGTMSNLETGWRNSAMQNPAFSQMAIPLQNQVGNTTAPSLGNVAGNANTVGGLAGESAGQSWAGLGAAAGNVANEFYKGY